MSGGRLKKIFGMILLICFISPIFADSDEANVRLLILTRSRLTRVYPELQAKFWKIKADMEKAFPQYKVYVIGQYRTCREQNDLYQKGRSKPGKIVTNARCGESLHNYSLAIDVLPYKNGEPVWGDWKFWLKLVKVVGKYGLTSGGAWKNLRDYTHIEMDSKLAFVKSLCGKDGCQERELGAVFNRNNPAGKPNKINDLAIEKPDNRTKDGKVKSRQFDRSEQKGATN
jgi:peptidoglycan L-alanyl-D-glutamate endopeptidase CwlK